MNSAGVKPRPRTVSFEERLAILVEELELAIKWQRPCVLLAVYSSDFLRRDVENAVKKRLTSLGQKSLHLSLEDRKPEELPAFFKEFKNPRRTVYVIDGFHRANGDEAGVYATLSRQREYFVERRIRTIFWLTPGEIAKLAHAAPEFWANRHRVVEFIQMPKSEEVQAQAMASDSQADAEPGAAVMDVDGAIPLPNPSTPDVAVEKDTLSARGNLLLSSGVQSWRTGDFEKADELLQEALQIATKIRDDRFEAACFNALGLLRSSTQRTDEAIDAYKQAIQLAPNQISVWNNLGTLCTKIGRNDEAMIAFRKALQVNPRDEVAWNGLANVHSQLGYPEDAIVAYRKAIQYAPRFAQPWCGLGDVYAGIGRSDDAEKSYRKAIALDETSPAAWIRLGALFKRQASYRDAAKAYQQAVELDPNDSDTWNDLGSVQMEAESLDEAAAALVKAIELDRAKGEAYGNLALVYMRQNKHKEAVSLLLRSVELLESNGDKAAAWNQLGSVYRGLNDYDNAVAAYQMADEFASLDEAIVEAPVEPPAQPEPIADQGPALGETLSEVATGTAAHPSTEPVVETLAVWTSDSGAAESGETRLDEQNPPDAPAWLFQRAGIAEGGETSEVAQATPAGAESVIELSASVALESNDGTAEPSPTTSLPRGEQPAEKLDAATWTAKGNGLFNQGAFDEAVAAYNAAIQLDPGYGPAYGNLALTYLTQGQSAEAILLYQKSIEHLESDGDKAISWNGLGNAYRRSGDYAHAVSAYQTAAELDPETSGIRDRADDFERVETPKNAQAWIDLGDVLLKTGSADKAAEAFRKAIEVEPQAGLGYSNLARALAAQGKHREAVTLFQRSIELLKDDKEKAAALNGLGNSYRKLNDYESAIRSYQKAVVLTDEGMDLLARTRFSLLSNVYINP